MPSGDKVSDGDGAAEGDTEFLHVFLLEAEAILVAIRNTLAALRSQPEEMRHIAALRREFHTLKGSGSMVGLHALASGALAIETLLSVLLAQDKPGDAICHAVMDDAQRELGAWVNDLRRHGKSPRRPDVLIAAAERVQRDKSLYLASEATAPTAQTPGDPAPQTAPGERRHDPAELIEDALDADLLHIFLEEGQDLLPRIGEVLQKLQQAPDDKTLIFDLLRPLHTLKGSARMAGAMRLGQQMHDLESRVVLRQSEGASSTMTIDDLLDCYDQGLQLFDALQKEMRQMSGPNGPPTSKAAPPAAEALVASESPVCRAPPLVRIHAAILDRSLNQATEMSISQSRLESQINALRQYASGLTDKTRQLGAQLREVGWQAEMPIAAVRPTPPETPHFDTLELDRHTQLQELTRNLADSVDDIAALQKKLSEAVDTAQHTLSGQARLTRDMQRAFMQARMVQFKCAAEPLSRMVRQMAKETGKQLTLNIVGSAVEIDRSILEKMIGPLQHLLRNAAVHGIETAERRRACGKKPVGRLLLEVTQDGHEVMLRVSDDGQGLDLARIRAQAVHQGLILPDMALSDLELARSIFHPGFSTSADVSPIAGRGVGMDVVRAEVALLGGRISLNTIAGQGVQFVIHLPASLAVSQVVLLELAAQTYAIPTLMVERVLHLKQPEQKRLMLDGTLAWHGRTIPVHYLPVLLGNANGMPRQRTLPVMVIKSDHDVVAIQVDRVIGSREVVIKHIGPQLAHMPGVVGATLLGDGSIVLILNPAQLTQRHSAQTVRHPPATRRGAAPAGKKTILVVDDSQTMRRIMQRLLVREGYHVMLATDGVDALHQMQNRPPDLMLVDIEMPQMDGFDLTRHLRGRTGTATLPIIMLTSRTAAKHRARAMALGVNAFLGKPYQDKVLLRMISGLVAQKRVRTACCVEDGRRQDGLATGNPPTERNLFAE